MVIKTTPQILKRISIRWLPDEAYENTDTIALNVGGFFLDLRVVLADESLEWSRAGERKKIAGKEPATFQWTRVIDSLASKQTDEAAFESLPNGDDLETGTFNKDGTLVPYEEVWRDVTADFGEDQPSWIIQSSDGSTFLGRVGRLFIGMRQDNRDGFAVRKEVYNESMRRWTIVFEGGDGRVQDLPRAVDVVYTMDNLQAGETKASDRIRAGDVDYVIRGYQ